MWDSMSAGYGDELEEAREAVKRLLEEEGFKVEFGGVVKGESGYEYKFDVVAWREGRRICLDFAGPEKGTLLLAMAKALDVKDSDFLILVKRAPPRLVEMLRGCSSFKAIPYERLTDLLESLRRHVRPA
ncbi:MAG: hypothetical protein DRJ96_02365 [Thermoprotei archaeon]|nr:MAG: hypothetical protein DRJ67_09610 [Thermoprotei archaeon]RLE97987.1 MAG: hypothetical protein DRJ96_02365 [Thermoprotei archaeon]